MGEAYEAATCKAVTAAIFDLMEALEPGKWRASHWNELSSGLQGAFVASEKSKLILLEAVGGGNDHIRWRLSAAGEELQGDPHRIMEAIADGKDEPLTIRPWVIDKPQAPAETNSSPTIENSARTPDSVADSPKKLPKSERVWKAIHAVNDYYKRVTSGKADKIPRNAILSMYLDKPIESSEVRNLARQLQNYRHLINEPADS